MERNNRTAKSVAQLQKHIGSGFGPASTAEDVIKGIDLHGKTAIVTGGYAGIGLETVRVLQQAGAKVIVPARDLAKATAALRSFTGVEIWPMDLMDPASIDAFAQRFLQTGQPLHILINNAGIMASPLHRDARGYESQFATNHLGHFQLTLRLWPALQQAKGARVVAVSSRGHRYSPVIFDDPNFERHEYNRWAAYGQSKTANILFALALDARGADEGIRAFSLHPGGILDTDLKRHMSEEELKKTGVLDEQGKPILDAEKGWKTIPQGAATTVWAATSPQLNNMGGLYCENADIAEAIKPEDAANWNATNPTGLVGVLPHAIDPEAAERLWMLSEELTGVRLS